MLPEVADVVTWRRECVGDAQRNAALERRSIVKASRPEKVEESGLIRGILPSLATPERSESTHHELHLRQVRATSGAHPQVLIVARTLGRGEGAIQVGRNELHELPARYTRRRPHRPVYTPSRYGSSAERTLTRARWSSTRVLVS